jgi:hypothetical protein
MAWDTTQVGLPDTDLRRAACVLIHQHGDAALARADGRYRWLAAQQSAAAPLWREIRDYLAHHARDPVKWRRLRHAAYPDAIRRLSGSHNGPIATADQAEVAE